MTKKIHKHAKTHPIAGWAEDNTSLWTLAFCNAQPCQHCDLCFSLDHDTAQYEAPEAPIKKGPEYASQNYSRSPTI